MLAKVVFRFYRNLVLLCPINDLSSNSRNIECERVATCQEFGGLFKHRILLDAGLLQPDLRCQNNIYATRVSDNNQKRCYCTSSGHTSKCKSVRTMVDSSINILARQKCRSSVRLHMNRHIVRQNYLYTGN